MGAGGFVAGILVALLSGVVARFTSLREDASFAASYLTALALGVTIVSLKGSSVDLMHILFGSILAVDDLSLLLVAITATITLLGMAIIYRPLMVECFNPGFLVAMGEKGAVFHYAFLALAVLNMVAAFQAIGTLMALGLVLLPAIAASFWTRDVPSMALVAAPIALFSSYVGLLVSFHSDLPSGPAIVLTAAGCYVLSLLLGARDSVRQRLASDPPARLICRHGIRRHRPKPSCAAREARPALRAVLLFGSDGGLVAERGKALALSICPTCPIPSASSTSQATC